MSDKIKILLLSGYHAASHRYWCDQLVQGLTEFDWTQVSLPDRHFYWRIRSNALTFSSEHKALLQQHYDLLVVTSMVDLCNLRGLMPHLSAVPAILYFHENQFAYPERKPNGNLINAQLTCVYAALSATQLVFNSTFNRDSFYAGAETLFKGMPDGTNADLLAHLPSRSSVIPVPVKYDSVQQTVGSNQSREYRSPVEIVWNHRWEYDKQPEVFFSALKHLIDSGVSCKVHVMGQSFREVPECFSQFQSSYHSTIETWGYQPEEHYRRVLKQADIVVSSALHDFQGLGMLEAIASGCTPVAPDRMAYPEYIPEPLLYSVGAGVEQEALNLSAALRSVIEHDIRADIEVDRYLTDQVLPRYRSLFNALVAGASDS